MNKLKECLCDMFPVAALNMSTDKLLKDKPKGIHYVKKGTYRTECGIRYNSYENCTEQMRNKRIIGNRKLSHSTTKHMEILKKEAGRHGKKK